MPPSQITLSLTSKQGDSWTSSSIGPLLTAERLNLLLYDFSSLDTSTKTCLLLAIGNLSPRAIKTNAKQLYQVNLPSFGTLFHNLIIVYYSVSSVYEITTRITIIKS